MKDPWWRIHLMSRREKSLGSEVKGQMKESRPQGTEFQQKVDSQACQMLLISRQGKEKTGKASGFGSHPGPLGEPSQGRVEGANPDLKVKGW